jgi:dethiobiotin synthetase
LPTPIFITGIGTDVGKTVVSAIVTEALQANYWKPIQAGYENGTDAEWVRRTITNPYSVVYPELYKLALPASPHIAAREENIFMEAAAVKKAYDHLPHTDSPLIIEGAGGLLVPINEKEFVADMVRALQAKVILVSRNYLGSINHSLLTAAVCKQYGLPVLGWIFNDQFMDYEKEIVEWSGYPSLLSVPKTTRPDAAFVSGQAAILKKKWKGYAI